jgi:hypothetical protein
MNQAVRLSFVCTEEHLRDPYLECGTSACSSAEDISSFMVFKIGYLMLELPTPFVRWIGQ